MGRNFYFAVLSVLAVSICWGCRTINSASSGMAGSKAAVQLVREIENTPFGTNSVKRNSKGEVVSLRLPVKKITRSNMLLVATIPSLQELKIYGGFTGNGALDVFPRLTNITKLEFGCFIRTNDPLLTVLLPAASRLPNLRELFLYGVFVPSSQYNYLSMMTNLESLKISYGHFGDPQVPILTNLVKLRSLDLRTVPVSDGRTNLFRDLPLTNFVFKPSEIPRYEFNFVDTPVVQALEDYEWISKKKLKIDVPPDIQWRKTIVMKTEPGHKLTKWHALRLLEKTLLEQVGIEIDESSDVVTVRYDPTIATHPAQK